MASRDSIGRHRRKCSLRGKHGRGGAGTNRDGGLAVAADNVSAEAQLCNALVRGCYRYDKILSDGQHHATYAASATDKGTLLMSAPRRRKGLCWWRRLSMERRMSTWTRMVRSMLQLSNPKRQANWQKILGDGEWEIRLAGKK